MWHGYWVDGWVDRYGDVSQCWLAGRKCQEALSLTDSICRGRGDTGQHQPSHKGCREHNGLFTFSAPTEHFTERVGCITKAGLLSQCVNLASILERVFDRLI